MFAMPLITQPEGYVLVVHGNLPMLQPETIRMLTDAAQGVAASRLVYCEEDEETRPCAAFCFEINHLRRFLERDLPHDVEAKHFIRALRMEGERVVDIYAPAVECAAVYDRESLWDCTYLRQQAINTRHMKNGVTFLDPNQAYIDAEVTIGEDTVIYPGVFLQGDTRIGRDVPYIMVAGFWIPSWGTAVPWRPWWPRRRRWRTAPASGPMCGCAPTRTLARAARWAIL